VSRAMQAARRRAGFDFPSRLGRRAEAGPRRVLPRVRPPDVFFQPSHPDTHGVNTASHMTAVDYRQWLLRLPTPKQD